MKYAKFILLIDPGNSKAIFRLAKANEMNGNLDESYALLREGYSKSSESEKEAF
jgi:hypothetical protein